MELKIFVSSLKIRDNIMKEEETNVEPLCGLNCWKGFGDDSLIIINFRYEL